MNKTTNKNIPDLVDHQKEERKIDKQMEDRENIYLQEEVQNKVLNFEDIQEITSKAGVSQKPKREPKDIPVLTEKEQESLNTWIIEMEKYIVQYAMERARINLITTVPKSKQFCFMNLLKSSIKHIQNFILNVIGRFTAFVGFLESE